MTNEEIKQAFFEGCPIKVKDDYGNYNAYKEIRALRYFKRKRNDGIYVEVSAEVLDGVANSISYVDPARCERIFNVSQDKCDDLKQNY